MRLIDWQIRFADFVRDRSAMPFSWGANDCCSFAAAGVRALTGRDPMAGIESYNDARGAARLIEEGGGLSALTAALLGTSVPPALAAVGDVVLVMNEGREMLGVCNGINVLAPGEDGIAVLEMNAAIAAWKI